MVIVGIHVNSIFVRIVYKVLVMKKAEINFELCKSNEAVRIEMPEKYPFVEFNDV